MQNQNRQSFEPGAIVFREGEPGNCAYIIERGQVELSALVNGQSLKLTVLGTGELLGEMALIDDQVRSATATVLETTELLIVLRTYVAEKLQLADPLLSMLLKVVLGRFREMRGRMVKVAAGLLKDDEVAVEAIETPSYQTEVETISRRLQLENKLAQALEREEFELHYHPIVDLQRRRIGGREALIRWRHPTLGLVPPMEFIGLAEETDLIKPIGDWIFQEACTAAQRFNAICDDKGAPVQMSVNLSRRQFEDSRLVERVLEIVNESGATAEWFKVEITESLLMSNPDLARHILDLFKSQGFTIAIDDFGTGYSSFSYLHRFSIDTLKIERSFISAMLDNTKVLAIVKSLISLSSNMDMNVVAEGVETRADEEKLREISCHYGQGYYYSKPLPQAEFEALLHRGLESSE